MFEAKHSEIATVPMQRRDVLAGLADPGPLCSAGAVMLPFALFRTLPARRWSVRFLGGDICFDDCPKTGPFNFSGAINTCSVREGLNGDVLALRLGPDEWLLIDSSVRGHSETEGRDEAAALAALDAAKWTIVDISHRNAAMRVSGGRARDVLNTGCLLDLDDRAFPVGRATRTLFGKAEIVLLREPDQNGVAHFRIECWRSFTTYVAGLLQQSARLIGAA